MMRRQIIHGIIHGLGHSRGMPTHGKQGGVVTPATVFGGGEKGLWLEPLASNSYTDLTGTTLATLGDAIARVNDLSPNGMNGTQPTLAARPLFATPGADFDGTDDVLLVTVPTGGIDGQLYYASSVGKGVFGYQVDAGEWGFGNYGLVNAAVWDKRIDGLILIDREFTTAEVSGLGSRFSASGNFDDLVDGDNMFQDSPITSLPPEMTLDSLESGVSMFIRCEFSSLPPNMTLPNLTNGSNIFRQASLIALNTGMTLPNLTSASAMFNGCSSLTTIPADFASETPCSEWLQAFNNTNLTQQSIDAILVNLAANVPFSGLKRLGQSGGSAPSSTGEAAIDTLRADGWTITVTGGY